MRSLSASELSVCLTVAISPLSAADFERDGQREGGVVRHRGELSGELLVRVAQRGDKARTLTGDRAALGDRARQALEIVRHAAGGFLEPVRVVALQVAHGVGEVEARFVDRLGRACAVGIVAGGEQRLGGRGGIVGGLRDVGRARHARQARAGDGLQR